MISNSIEIPGLLERRRLTSGGEALTFTGQQDGNDLQLGISTSIAQLDAARSDANSSNSYVAPRVNAWLNGTYQRYATDGQGAQKGEFGLFSTGVDMLLDTKTRTFISVGSSRSRFD